MTRLTEEQLISLFHEPRTVSSFTEEPVTDEQLRRIQELTFYGPTAFNSQPLRITWVKSPEARERLVAHLADGNKAKTQAAPVTAILSADANWVEHADTFNPNAAGFIKGFYTTEELATPAAQAGRGAERSPAGRLLHYRNPRPRPGCRPHDRRRLRRHQKGILRGQRRNPLPGRQPRSR